MLKFGKPVNSCEYIIISLFSSVQFSHSVLSDSLQPHESQHARPPCPSPTLRLMSIESVMPSSNLILCRPILLLPQSLPESESFPMSQLFTWGGQNTGVGCHALLQGIFPTQGSNPHLSVQFSRSVVSIWLFATPWIAAQQASLSITNSWSSLKLMSIESVMPSNHLILCGSFPNAPNPSQNQSLFQWVNFSHEVAKVLEFQL